MLELSWSSAAALLSAAGLWASAGAVAGIVGALLLAPLASRWTGGGWAAGCAWLVLLTVGLASSGLYAGATYGVALRGQRLVEREWVLERLAAATVLVVAERQGIQEDEAVRVSPLVAEARQQIETRVAASSIPGAAALGLGVPQMVTAALDALEGIDGLTVADLHDLHAVVGGHAGGVPGQQGLSAPARNLLTVTGAVRGQAVAALWAAALPHFLVAGLFASGCLALVLVVGLVKRLGSRQSSG